MTRPFDITLCLVPGYSTMSLASALEPLRMANRLADREIFRWAVVSVDGEPARASSGVIVNVDHGLAAERKRLSRSEAPDMVLVAAGLDVETRRYPELERWLVALHRRRIIIGGISTAAYMMADAGLLDGRTCTLHWENLPAFAERYPTVEVRQELCVIDGNLLTCAGGTSAIDMMLHVIAEKSGRGLARGVADQLILPAVRPLDQRQRGPIGTSLRRASPVLAEAVKLMEEQIATRTTLGGFVGSLGLSRRQVERLFRAELGKPPARYFLELRLERARHLLLQTDMPVIEVATACGFVSASHFSRCFSRLYGASPQAARLQRRT